MNSSLQLDNFDNLLELAVKHGNDQTLDLLLSHVTIVSLSSAAAKWTEFLKIAVENGLYAIFQRLLDYAIKFNFKISENNTLLHMACYYSYYEIALSLLNIHSNVEHTDATGNKPLHYALNPVDQKIWPVKDPKIKACIPNPEKVIRLLLERGANPKAKNSAGKTPYALARNDTFLAILNDFLFDPLTLTLFKLVKDKDIINLKNHLNTVTQDITKKDEKGWNLLHLASDTGDVDIVSLLLQTNQFDLEDKTNYLRTPLHLAAARNHREIIKKLVTAGASLDCQDDAGYTPLHLAVSEGHNDMVSLLIQLGANVQALDNNQETPIELAKSLDKQAIVITISQAYQTFLSKTKKRKIEIQEDSSEPSKKQKLTNTSKPTLMLRQAAQQGDLTTVQKLIVLMTSDEINEAGSSSKKTALHRAIENNHPHIVKLLVDRGSDINFPDNEGNNAWHLALANAEKNKSIIKILIECNNAEGLKMKNKMGLNPINLFCERKPDLISNSIEHTKQDWIKRYNNANRTSNNEPSMKDILYLLIGQTIKSFDEIDNNTVYILTLKGDVITDKNSSLINPTISFRF